MSKPGVTQWIDRHGPQIKNIQLFHIFTHQLGVTVTVSLSEQHGMYWKKFPFLESRENSGALSVSEGPQRPPPDWTMHSSNVCCYCSDHP